MKFKVFVDGQEGTTGLEINERLQARDDIEILSIDPNKRKDISEKKKYINLSDMVFLCLPDEAAREAVSLVENPKTKIIDASTAHRVAEGWTYGIPELGLGHRKNIETSTRLSNPGCFATGFNVLVYPLIKEGIMLPDYPLSCHATTGYSGGGKKLIERFESEANKKKLQSPCFYALGLGHKHLPEMQKHSGLSAPPVFTPIVANYYRGMVVAIPLHTARLNKKKGAGELCEFYTNYYAGQNFVKVLPFGIEDELEWGYMDAIGCNHTNKLEILVFGNENEALLAARLDNLGKGASGAAVQNMNIMLGLDETCGLI